MKKLSAFMILLFLCWSTILFAEDFLGAPVMPGGKTIRSQNDRLEKTYDTTYPDAVNYYKDALKKLEHVKFWDRGTETYIEDHSNRPWHSITIMKSDGGTQVVTVKDNWTWIIGTLVLRFIAVFVVLLVLYVAMSLSGAVLSRVGQATEAKK